METPNKQLDRRASVPPKQGVIHCRDMTREKENGFGLKAVNWEKVTRKYMGEMEKEGSFSFSKGLFVWTHLTISDGENDLPSR